MASCAMAALSSVRSMATVASIFSETNCTSFTSRWVTTAAMVSMVTSRARGAASLGVVAWLVSVSYVTGADMEELHGEEGQQESQEQLELPERCKLMNHPNMKTFSSASTINVQQIVSLYSNGKKNIQLKASTPRNVSCTATCYQS